MKPRTSYITGFVLSLGLTLVAYLLVRHPGLLTGQILSHATLIIALASLALCQLIVQLVFFLHLIDEPSPRWNLLAFLFMLLILIIIVFGSLWIMHNLNYHMMSPSEINTYMHDHEGF